MSTEDLVTALKSSGKLDSELVDNIVRHYKEMRNHYVFGRFEETGLHAGKFCENAANLVLYILTGKIETSPQLGNLLDDIEKAQSSVKNVDDMLRITIPRVLRAAYEIRNKRNTVHENMKIDLNEIDSRCMVSLCSWVLSEFIRIFYTGSMNEATNLIERIIQIDFPFIDDYDGKKLIMSNNLSVPEEVLVHLTNVRVEVDIEELAKWIPNTDINHIRTVLRQLKEKRFVYYEGNIAKITPLGANSARETLTKVAFRAN
jgi:hypothetical protein